MNSGKEILAVQPAVVDKLKKKWDILRIKSLCVGKRIPLSCLD